MCWLPFTVLQPSELHHSSEKEWNQKTAICLSDGDAVSSGDEGAAVSDYQTGHRERGAQRWRRKLALVPEKQNYLAWELMRLNSDLLATQRNLVLCRQSTHFTGRARAETVNFPEKKYTSKTVIWHQNPFYCFYFMPCGADFDHFTDRCKIFGTKLLVT